ncbi:MAG: helix-turn-helix transcriptional regulator [Ruminococcus sp.]|nr:helix-turn-helix transcriptional regulator [Ruminococcus sp.]
MPFRLDKIFTTVKSNPTRTGNYIEIEPCDALKPYIRCFWGSKRNKADFVNQENKKTLVIPDICMDIIVTENAERNTADSNFCGINNFSYFAEESSSFCFGIRFYAWSVVLFSDESMNGVLNAFLNADAYFSGFAKALNERLYNAVNIYERKAIAENFLLSKLNAKRENFDIMNSLYFIISSNGNAGVAELSDYCVISKRQLERRFVENIGVSPKQMINLIRYQLLWQECLKDNFNILDAVEKFGYYDQSHMIKEFKKYHGMSINMALENVSHFYNTNPRF